LRIRPAESADASAIAAVHTRSWQAAYRGQVPQDYLDRLSPAERLPVWERLLTETRWPRRGILVAEADHRVVGFASLVPTRDEDQDPATVAEIASIYLAPETWGRGIGKALMATATAALTRAAYREATLWVLNTNTRARRFYEATGWQIDGAVKQDSRRGFTLTEIRYRRIFARSPQQVPGVHPGGCASP
jgi:ribosomal protein S18 acetylase RimI-like enzyme